MSTPKTTPEIRDQLVKAWRRCRQEMTQAQFCLEMQAGGLYFSPRTLRAWLRQTPDPEHPREETLAAVEQALACLTDLQERLAAVASALRRSPASRTAVEGEGPPDSTQSELTPAAAEELRDTLNVENPISTPQESEAATPEHAAEASVAPFAQEGKTPFSWDV